MVCTRASGKGRSISPTTARSPGFHGAHVGIRWSAPAIIERIAAGDDQSVFGSCAGERGSIITPVARGVGRFQVMATLQAARAKALGLPAASAKSWGLNRAIYYAAAKRGFTQARGQAPALPKGAPEIREHFLGDDKGYAVRGGGALLFTIGGEVQTPEAFRKQIEARFAGTFADAWKEAQAIVAAVPRAVLESREEFYLRVYRPRRDVLAAKWEERAATRREGAKT